MKKRNILLTVLSVITAICAAMFLTACFSSETKNDGPTTNTADIVYVSEKDAVITKVNGRDYVKAQDGIAAVGVVYINGYTGPVLVGYDAASVQYTFKYGGNNLVKDYFTVDYNGTTYYYSKNDGFMSGDHRGNCSIYTCAATELYAAALEILAKTEAEKFKLEYNEISTAEQLKAIAGSSERFKLTTDINLINEDDWTPIENFSGTLFGNGKTINNLTIENSAEENVGLFGTLQGTITDLVVKNANVTTRGNKGKAGIVAGTNKGTISDVTIHNSCEINATYYDNVGGIVGYNDNGIILNCKNEGNVTGANKVGGVVGCMCMGASEKIKGCINEGLVTGSDSVGGIAGYIVGTGSGTETKHFTITDNENNGAVTGKDKVGGIFGEVYGGEWKYYGSYYHGNFDEMSLLINNANAVIKGEKYTGGVIGYAKRLSVLTTSENHEDVTGGIYVGGLIGYSSDTNIKATGFINEVTITGTAYVGGIAGYAGIIENATNKGTVKTIGVTVEDEESRAYVGGIAEYCTGIIGCKNEAEIKEEKGGAYVGGIAGFVCTYSSERANNNENTGTITATESNSVGGIAGYLVGGGSGTETKHFTITDNENNGVVTGKDKVGGIFGEVYGGEWKYYGSYYHGNFDEMSLLINNAEVNGSTSGQYTGGLIGYAERLSVLTTSENNKGVTGGDYVGGFVGYASGANIKATGFVNTISVTGKGYVGGIAGYAGIIENATNKGKITSTDVIFEENVNRAYVGGIAGYCSGIIACKNDSDITVSTDGQYVGGIAGYVDVYNTDNKVNNNINNGIISAENSDNVGGIAGYVQGNGSGTETKQFSISGNENNGAVTGKDKVGGIFGEVNGGRWKYYGSYYYGYFEVTNCRNNKDQISGTTSNVGGIIGYQTRLKTNENLLNTNTDVTSKKIGNLS